MIRRIATSLSIFVVASAILIISLLRSAKVEYAFELPVSSGSERASGNYGVEVNYPLAYPGDIRPDHVLWPVKVARDKLWIATTKDPLKKAKIALLIADKRLESAQGLLEKGKVEVAVSTLTKAEMYLEESFKFEEIARGKGIETGQFLERFSFATLKHREVLEEFLIVVPEDAMSVIVKALDYPKTLYQEVKVALQEVGRPVPKNPFEG